MSKTNRNQMKTEACAKPGQEKQGLSRVVGMLQELQDAVEEIRAQLAGTSKSHFTVGEVARMVGRSPYTIRMWVTEQRIRAERVAGTGPRGRLLIPREELRKLITQGHGESVPTILTK